MRNLKLIILFISLITTFGCNKNESEDLKNLDVDEYVAQLKQGKYKERELPAFTSKDIPALLKYRNETQTITNFPHNGISSLWMPECSLGMYVLWTIESIRAVEIDSKYLIGRFPSQNPIVKKREGGSQVVSNNQIQTIISNAYSDWWNKNPNFNALKNIDPLSGTEYKWH